MLETKIVSDPRFPFTARAGFGSCYTLAGRIGSSRFFWF